MWSAPWPADLEIQPATTLDAHGSPKLSTTSGVISCAKASTRKSASAAPMTLRSALRQNPDVVLIGEMRDPETIAIAVTLAETGHLVFATLHTSDAPGAIDRIIDVFPGSQQQQIRIQLAASLMGVVAQLLLPRVGGGRVACFEVMLANPAVRGQIREGKTQTLRTTIITGVADGMQSMEMSLVDRVKRGQIRLEDAQARSLHHEELTSLLKQGGLSAAAAGPLARRAGVAPAS